MDNIDVNFGPHHPNPLYNRQQVLQKYANALQQLRTLAEESYRVRPYFFDNYVMFHYFQQRSSMNDADMSENNYSTLAFFKVELLKHILDRRRQILYWLFYLLLAFLCVLAYRHETSSSVAERSMQSISYPSMRMWRRLTLPLIQRFPRLTELYDESCLMENPFFQIEQLDCEPCSHVKSILDLTQTEDIAYKNEDHFRAEQDTTDQNSANQHFEFVPFVFRVNQDPIELSDLYKIYANNHEIFQRDAYRVQSTNRDVTNLEELFSQFNHSQNAHQAQTHNMWRSNRMLPARLLRQLFVRPTRLPRTGIAMERYMAIDTAQAPAYTLPDTECANAYIQQALGTRFIIMRPTSECRHKCRTLSMRLPQSFVLSYNWWYWKPISAPDPVSDTLSISLIGSYC